MFYRDKFYDYKKLCERISLVKSKCNPPPPPDYPFLRTRPKKQEMERERQKDIEYNKDLLLKKYKYMYKKNNQYHPSNLKFQPHPSSLKLSQGTQQYYELCNNNRFLGNKIKEVQRKKGNYNCGQSLKHYKKLKYLGDEMVKSSKYNNNILLNLVTPHTYEKRLNQLMQNKTARHRIQSSKPFNRISTRLNTYNYCNNDINNENINKIDKIEANNKKVIQIERESLFTN
jgi:hypothetical protein